jgi:hypothetical protein
MNAVVNGARSRSTVLTAAAGLLLLGSAVVMMVAAAPRIHAVRHASVTNEQLASWVWVTPGHAPRVTPATVGDATRMHQALVP